MTRVASTLLILVLASAVWSAEPKVIAPIDSSPFLAGHTGEQAKQFIRAMTTLGDHGVLAISSQARLEQVRKLLTDAGWEPPKADVFRHLDFEKHMLLLVYECGDAADAFAYRGYRKDANVPELDLTMSYVIHKKRGETVNRCNFLMIRVPASPAVMVSIRTYHPTNGGPHPTPDKALLEWRAEVGPARGDVVDNLRGRIEVEKPAATVGNDIRVRFTLMLADACVEAGRFATKADAVTVWDGKYSNGYSNGSFLVGRPDGNTVLLRPAAREWDKNAPHPVQITAARPYVLPDWTEALPYKSLMVLGLNTASVGEYHIIGVYAETGGAQGMSGKPVPFWGGCLATQTVTVRLTRD